MFLKYGAIIVIVILLSQTISSEAKKKRPTSSLVSVTSYMEDIADFVVEAWDALVDLIPSKPSKKNKKNKKKKKKQESYWNWDINYYFKAAQKKYDHVYNTFKNSLKVFQIGTPRDTPDVDIEDAFSVEVIASEFIERLTYVLFDMLDGFDRKS